MIVGAQTFPCSKYLLQEKIIYYYMIVFSIVISITYLTTSSVYFCLKSIQSCAMLVHFDFSKKKTQCWLSCLYVMVYLYSCIYILKSIWSHAFNMLNVYYTLYSLLIVYIYCIFLALVEPSYALLPTTCHPKAVGGVYHATNYRLQQGLQWTHLAKHQS